jgi:methionyl aminopeptidase
MSSYIKKQYEIDLIIEGGRQLGAILEDLGKMVRPGMSTLEVDAAAEARIREIGGRPAFKGYESGGHTPFPTTICASVNEEVVHGIATKEKVLQDGDIFSIDIGMEWPVKGLKESQKNTHADSKHGGFFTDTAITVPVGSISDDDTMLLERTYESMLRGIEVSEVGSTVADIGRVVEDYISPFGYGIVEDLCGHGVGYGVHEDPNVLFYYDKRMEKWKLEPGMIICIEPMINAGTKRVGVAKDGWSIITSDGARSAHFEHTIVITNNGPVRATRRPGEKALPSEK